jgi:hypothetical protein
MAYGSHYNHSGLWWATYLYVAKEKSPIEQYNPRQSDRCAVSLG